MTIYSQPTQHQQLPASTNPNPSKPGSACQDSVFPERHPDQTRARLERSGVAAPIVEGICGTERTFRARTTLSRSGLKILVFDGTNTHLPNSLLKRVIANDRAALIKRKWDSVIDTFLSHPCTVPDVIVDISTDRASVIRRMNEIWDLRVRWNYSPRPAYFAISKTGNLPLLRFEIERLDGRFLYLCDVPNHFNQELEQIRLKLSALLRSLPHWQLAHEGQGVTSRAVIHLIGTRTRTRLGGSDRHVAVFAAMLKRNALPRSIGDWLKMLAEDSLFKPAGGSLEVPSRNTLKMYIHRDFPRYLQAAFDSARSGYSSRRVIERVILDSKTMGYKIRGQLLQNTYY
jgi:hypothetical protein